jgi:hypothetical protein
MAGFLRGLCGFAKVSTTAHVIFEKDTSGSRQLDALDENETDDVDCGMLLRPKGR